VFKELVYVIQMIYKYVYILCLLQRAGVRVPSICASRERLVLRKMGLLLASVLSAPLTTTQFVAPMGSHIKMSVDSDWNPVLETPPFPLCTQDSAVSNSAFTCTCVF